MLGVVVELLTKKSVASLLGVHPEHVMRLTRQGRFPKPLKLGPGEGAAVRFIKAEIENWLAERVAARRDT